MNHDDAAATLLRIAAATGSTPPRAKGDRAARALGLIREVSFSDLRRMEARFRALVERIPAVTFMAALDGGLNDVYVSPQIEALLGYTQREWASDPVLWFRRLHPEDRGVWNREFARGCMTGGPFRADCRFIARSGDIVWVRGEAAIERDERGRPLFLQGLAYDITETKRAEELIKASLREKETLLKEIHHRVKNNLQITSSLLKLQGARVADEPARRALAEGQGRIQAIALVHEMLYRGADLSRIDFAEYVRRLLEQIARAEGSRHRRIAVSTEIEDTHLGIDSAVPCGLLIGELASNSFKHAFPGERGGTILVSMRTSGGVRSIAVRDDGIGLPAGFDPQTSGSLGLDLVRALTRQLHGDLELSSSPAGTRVVITMPAQSLR